MNEKKQFKVKLPSGRYRDASDNEIAEAACALIVAKNALAHTTIHSPTDTETYLRSALGGLERERFAIIFLDNRHRVIAFEVLFDGTIDGTSVYPREVVKRALEVNSAAVILAHNHPSGVAEPSQADERITRRLKQGLELVDIRLLDHLVISHGECTSLASRGLI
jgi:DNA repair protein RadC